MKERERKRKKKEIKRKKKKRRKKKERKEERKKERKNRDHLDHICCLSPSLDDHALISSPSVIGVVKFLPGLAIAIQV